jgi:hypothetical protein
MYFGCVADRGRSRKAMPVCRALHQRSRFEIVEGLCVVPGIEEVVSANVDTSSFTGCDSSVPRNNRRSNPFRSVPVWKYPVVPFLTMAVGNHRPIPRLHQRLRRS